MHNEELHNLYYSPSKIRMINSRRMRWAGRVARMGRRYMILVGKPEGKRLVGRPRRWWMYYIKLHLIELGWDGVDWIDLDQEWDQWRALVNTVMNLRVPQNAGKFLSSYTITGFSRRAHLHE
jgi:hypothetical protein